MTERPRTAGGRVLLRFAQIVAETSNDPHLVREADRILAARIEPPEAERAAVLDPERLARALLASGLRWSDDTWVHEQAARIAAAYDEAKP